MVEQITKGVKISVKTTYDGMTSRGENVYCVFSYFITIENNSTKTIQLTHRFWKISHSLHRVQVVKGEGVVGEKPILYPNDTYAYSSKCFLEAAMGSMTGFYAMKDLKTEEVFKVNIPNFPLFRPEISN